MPSCVPIYCTHYATLFMFCVLSDVLLGGVMTILSKCSKRMSTFWLKPSLIDKSASILVYIRCEVCVSEAQLSATTYVALSLGAAHH